MRGFIALFSFLIIVALSGCSSSSGAPEGATTEEVPMPTFRGKASSPSPALGDPLAENDEEPDEPSPENDEVPSEPLPENEEECLEGPSYCNLSMPNDKIKLIAYNPERY